MPSKNSIVGDSLNYHKPVEPEQPKPAPKSDWVKLAKSRKYKDVDQYIEVRKEFFRHYLPDGTALRNIQDPHLVGLWVQAASTIIDELEAFQARIQGELDNERVQG